jgi:hypothetical protein
MLACRPAEVSGNRRTGRVQYGEMGRSTETTKDIERATLLTRPLILLTLTAFANAHATLVRDVAVPDGAFRVEADAAWDAAVDVGPHPPVGQAAIGCDVKRREPVALGLGEDQCRVVGRHDDAIGECDAIRYLPSRAIGGDQREDSGDELALREVEAGVADVDVAPTVHDNVDPGVVRDAAQVGMDHQRPVGLPAQQKPIAR